MPRARSIPVLLFFCVLGLCATALCAPAEAAERRETLLFSSCARASGEYRGRYRGQILLHQAFLGEAGGDTELGPILRASIEQQLRYLWGHYRNDPSAHAALQISLGAEPPQIRVLSKKQVPYGRALELPYPAKEAKLKIEDPYTRRAIARGRTRKSDPAWLVEYELSFPLAICGRGEDPAAKLRVPLPPDPWLVFWYVPMNKHRPLRYHHVRARTNPCSDDDFADLPHPYYYWYDWMPSRHGLDDDGRGFDCRDLLKLGDHHAEVEVALERVGAATHDFGALRSQLGRGLLRATVVVGAVDHATVDLLPDWWKDQLGDGAGAALQARAAQASKRAAQLEGGTRGLLSVIDELPRVMDIERHRSLVEEGSLVVEVTGKLHHSARPLVLRLALAFTDVFGPVKPRHFGLLRRALSEDQLVVYWGHSGIGENFRLAQIEAHAQASHAQLTSELKRSPLRLVAFLSCYSYMYFGQDLLAAGAERDDGAYFIFTGTEQAKKEAGPLAVLELVDEVLRPENPKGRLDGLARLAEDEFWLIKEVTKARP